MSDLTDEDSSVNETEETMRIRANRAMVAKMLKLAGASTFFGISSFAIVMVNKIVLTTYHFPSFQIAGLGQITTIMSVLWIARTLGLVDFPGPSIDQFKKVFPLPVFYLLNLLFGLGSTKKLNLPMFTVLRRFTLLFTSIGQIYILNKYESLQINITLVFMIGGALVAALNDLAFDLSGYLFILANNLATSANTLYSKKMLNADMGKLEIMFYNALLVFLPAVVIAVITGEFTKAYNYNGWSNPYFLLFFSLSCIMGFVLIYSTILVTQLTSPLTLMVVGCIKNVLVTYSGMFVGGDYQFEIYNFVGINISVLASLFYSYFKFKEQQQTSQKIPTVQQTDKSPDKQPLNTGA